MANAYVNDATPSIYSLNRNYEAYTIEKTVGNCDFTLWDESTVKRLLVEQPDIMPYYPPERALQRGFDLAYGKDQITKRVTSGIIRGISPGKIANELMAGITTMNRESAVRAARTGITAAENAGRLDSWRAAENMGITIRRQWVCTKDARTRFGHAMADGQTVEGTKTPFIVGGEKMMFPGDKSLGAHGWNIYNCRCTTRTVEKDGIEAEPRQMRVRDPETGEWKVVNEMTYADWEKWKKTGIQPTIQTKSSFTPAKTIKKNKKNSSKTIEFSEENGIIEVDELTPCLRRLSDNKIINTTVYDISPKAKDFKDWEFDWTIPKKNGFIVRAIKADGDDRIQGLVALKPDKRNSAVLVDIVEAAPFNNPHNKLFISKEYSGVGGHLFAEAVRESYKQGFEGYVYFRAKSDLIEHYQNELGAVLINPRERILAIEERSAKKLYDRYYKEK